MPQRTSGAYNSAAVCRMLHAWIIYWKFAMPIQIIETKRLYRQISDQLRELIIAGEFPVDSRLPSERDLSVQLGVSRPSLREALIALEVEGYIEVRMGSGIYVCEPPPGKAGFDLSSEEGPLELIQARAMIEGEVAATAAKAGRKADFDAVEAAIEQMEADAKAGIVPIEADCLFHVRVAEATGNSVLVGTVKRLFELRLGPLFEQLHSHFESPDVWAQAIAEHRDVLKALRTRNPEKAKAAMRRHMDIAYKRLSASVTRAPRRKAAAAKTGLTQKVKEGNGAKTTGKRAKVPDKTPAGKGNTKGNIASPRKALRG
jgi:DNA-binding FadR family transcriptional regulator